MAKPFRNLILGCLGSISLYLVGHAPQYVVAADTSQVLANTECTVASSVPLNGELLVSKGTGEHRLTIHNAPGADAIIKLKDRDLNTVLAMYVKAGATASVSVPSGSMQFQYATGHDYSADCVRFLTDMQASKDPDYHSYETTRQGNYIYTSEVSYTLKRVSSGNFQPSNMSNSAF